MTFVDVASLAGVDASSQDSTAVCYGDIDNNGYPDILVLGKNEPNRLFKNQGNGAFTELLASGIEGGNGDSSLVQHGRYRRRRSARYLRGRGLVPGDHDRLHPGAVPRSTSPTSCT